MFICISAMSEPRREIYRQLAAGGKQVLRHLIRLMLYPDDISCNHWESEIVAFVGDVDKVKGRNKFPNKSFILDALQVQNDMIEQVTKQVVLTERDLHPHEVTQATLTSGVEFYQNWLATKLSADGIIDPHEAFCILEKVRRLEFT